MKRRDALKEDSKLKPKAFILQTEQRLSTSGFLSGVNNNTNSHSRYSISSAS